VTETMFSYLEQFSAGTRALDHKILAISAEASWITGRWQWLQDRLPVQPDFGSPEFDVGLGRALLALHNKDESAFITTVESLRRTLIGTTSPSTTASIQACHAVMLKLHVLYEVETISGLVEGFHMEKPSMLDTLDRRLEVVGAQLSEKQYILGIRRAAMEKSRYFPSSKIFLKYLHTLSLKFTQLEVAASWLASAKLARKANLKSAAYNAVLRAARLGDETAKIEYSRLLWKDGHHRQAIQNLEGAIAASGFHAHDDNESVQDTGATGAQNLPQNPAVARVCQHLCTLPPAN
jgi:serine/threonine-protein kinase ATR